MALQPGTRLEHYEVLEPIGAGGMGEVYRAVDTKLRREVAIKILPAVFASDPSRLARFEREAHVLASLNHPHIAAIYGLEHANGVRFLVLELVEGPTLAERLASGLPELAETLRIAGEIAEALECAHDKGVVHRDLKPSNIKLTAGGKVKVLDFGLAKALGEPEADLGSDPSNSPTATMQETRAGIVLGTAAYMSPEQAEGKPSDKRSDVWSFGVVLYEMLTGRRCFEGKTTSHILVHVLEQEPDWGKLPDETPAGVRDLLTRCLRKDPAQRPRDVGDLRLQIEDFARQAAAPKAARPPVRQRAESRGWLWRGVAAAATLAALVFAFLYFRPRPGPSAELTRFDIAQPADLTFSDQFAVSPDGRHLAFIAAGAKGTPQVWIRSLDAVEPRPLAGTDPAAGTLFWSPDSRYLVFWSPGKLQKIEVSGGPAQTLCDAPALVFGGFWTADGKIVFGMNANVGLQEVSAAGGAVVPVTTLANGEIRHGFPVLLPDGHHFIYTGYRTPQTGGIYLGSLDAKPEQQRLKLLLSDASPVEYAPPFDSGDGSGYLLFVRAGTLMAQRFDARGLQMGGEAVPVAEQVASTPGTRGFSVSRTGVLVYRAGGGQNFRLSWFDRHGKELGQLGAAHVNPAPAPELSPDGKRVAFTSTDPQSGNIDIWLYELARGVSTRFTFDPSQDSTPVWSPDGSRIAFASNRSPAGIYQKPSNMAGTEELLLKTVGGPTSWSRDGRFLLYQPGGPKTLTDIWVLPMTGPAEQRHPQPFVHSEFAEQGGRFSPDGRYISYISNESSRLEVYVRPFDPTASPDFGASGGKWQVSKDGGDGAHWREDGKEILYMAPDHMMMSVDVTTRPVFQAGVPKPLFKSAAIAQFWEIRPDAQQFLIPVPAGANAAAPYKVVLNWTAALKR